jgi:hypothetical protein
MYYGADDIFPSENAGRVMDKNKDNKDNSHGTGVASNPKPDIRGRLRGHFRFIGDYSLQYRCSPRLRANCQRCRKFTKANGGQRPNCVIVSSTRGEGIKREDPEETLEGKRLLRVIKYLHNLVIPIVLASGNNEDEPRRTIDTCLRFWRIWRKCLLSMYVQPQRRDIFGQKHKQEPKWDFSL